VPEVLLVDDIRGGSVGPLLFISLAIMGSPGPATISLMAAGSAYGARRSLSYLIGIVVGTTIVFLAVATGITAAVLAVPAIGSNRAAQPCRVVGAAFEVSRDGSCTSSRTIVQDSRYRELLRSDV
jgi:hypothetical protein